MANWTDGVPGSLDFAAHRNGGTIDIRRSARAKILDLNSSQFNGTINHLRGRSEFESVQVIRGVFHLEGGQINAGTLDVGQRPILWRSFSPPLLQPIDWEGGLGNPIDVVTGVIGVLPDEGSQAWDFESDVFRFPPIVPLRRFEQNGGRLEVADRLSVYQGTFELRNGRVQTNSLLIDASQSFSIDPTDSFSIDLVRDGVLQTGGLLRASSKVLIQDGAYTLEGGRFQAETLAIGDPAIESNSGIFKLNRSPAFRQTGGRSHISGDLEMCAPAILDPVDPIELLPFRNVSYRLEGGRLRVDGNVTVGSLGVAPVAFSQTGGNASFGGTLRIEGESSRYDFSDGRLRTNVLEVGMGVFNDGGTFLLGETADLIVQQRVSWGAESVFRAEEGSRMRILGGSFENFSQDEQALDGLNNLELIFDGEDQSNTIGDRLSSTLEIGGQDLGSVLEGFEGNFALDTLRVGGRFPTTLQLIDLVDNQPDHLNDEALYVDHLVVNEGSTLDLDGLPIYYRSAQILGSIIGGTASQVKIVPEPTSLVLTLSVIVFSGLRNRQRRTV